MARTHKLIILLANSTRRLAITGRGGGGVRTRRVREIRKDGSLSTSATGSRGRRTFTRRGMPVGFYPRSLEVAYLSHILAASNGGERELDIMGRAGAAIGEGEGGIVIHIKGRG